MNSTALIYRLASSHAIIMCGLFAASLLKCQSNPTPAAEHILIRERSPQDCEYIDQIELRCCQLGYQRNQHQTRILLQNAAAEAGANLISEVVINELRLDTGSGIVPIFSGRAEAWKCPPESQL